MERNINIAEILKSKSKGTKLYSAVFGQMIYIGIVYDTNGAEIWLLTENRVDTLYLSDGKYREGGEVTLYPSKEMRDWEKFAWKRGDVLSCGVDNLCIFEKWANKEYTEFYAKFVTPNYSGNTFKTEKWSKETNEAVIKQYISNIEEFKGGKLNLTTLEIEKTQPEFKDGDIVIYGKSVAICRKIYKHTLSFYVSLDEMLGLLFDDKVESSEEYRFAKEEEKQQLFDALAKKNKAWDANKKQIVDLKPKIELKPFDKVLVRNGKDKIWEPAFFFRNRPELNVCKYQTVGGKLRVYCIPFNEETAKLIGTTNNWEG